MEIDIYKTLILSIITVFAFWIFSRLFWRSMFKGFFEELDKYRNRNKEDKTMEEE